MPQWSIRIVPVDPANPAGPAAFAPQGGSPGQPQATWDGDTVTWNNTTDAAHWPWPTDQNYQPLSVQPGDIGYMSDNVPARLGSRPDYSVNLPPSPPPPMPYVVYYYYWGNPPAPPPPAASYVVYYYCKNHPNEVSERGSITVIAPPSPPSSS